MNVLPPSTAEIDGRLDVFVVPAKAIELNAGLVVPKSYVQSVAVAFVGIMLTTYGVANSVIAAAFRKSLCKLR